MKIENTDIRASLDGMLAEAQQLQAGLKAIAYRAKAIQERETTYRKSAEAAEAEGAGQKEKVRELLRATSQPNRKELQAASAGQRQAYEMAAEYRALADECSLQLEEVLLNSGEKAGTLKGLNQRIIDRYAEALIDEALGAIGNKLACAMRLKDRLFSDRANQQGQVYWDARDYLTTKVAGALKGFEMMPAGDDEFLSSVAAACHVPNGITPLSVLQKKTRMADFERRRAAFDANGGMV